MNLTIDQLFMKIGYKQIIIEGLEAQVAELQAEIEKLKGAGDGQEGKQPEDADER